MFAINPPKPQVAPAILAKLAKVETATVGHFCHSGFMDPAIKATIPERRVVGTAVTARVPGFDGTVTHLAVSMARPGDILVVERCGDLRHSNIGGVVALGAQLKGMAGIVTEGMTCDWEEFRQLDFPVWSRGITPITVKALGLDGQVNVPISCGGVAVKPGDAILADENGVLVLDPSEVDEVADRAIAMQEEEKRLIERMKAGEELADVFGARKLVEKVTSTPS